MRNLLILGLSLIITTTNQLSVLAQTRQPTKAEIQRYMKKFEQNVRLYEQNKNPISPPKDDRTQAEKQQRRAFVKAWSKKEPILSSFLGSWTEIDMNILIYPSNIKNNVCIVVTGEGNAYFFTGNLFYGAIKDYSIISDSVEPERLLFNKKEYLKISFVKNGKIENNDNNLYKDAFNFLNAPKPLPKINQALKFLDGLGRREERIRVINEFRKYQCSDSLPRN